MTILEQLRYRTVHPTDIPVCVALEKASYPEDEAASKSQLQFRQHHAAPYFRCAVVGAEDNERVLGFVCSTRCQEFTHESMATHVSDGPLLAIHSVVVDPEFRGQGVATAMLKDYILAVRDDVQKIVLLAKQRLLPFYLNCGFSVLRPSPIVHGQDLWYDLELNVERKGFPYRVLDAFADVHKPGASGNPAAVVQLDAVDLEDSDILDWMQTVAQEFNHSETAFLWPYEVDSNGHCESSETHFCIRYFTPTVEVPLCGHATLAAAAYLYQTTVSQKQTVVFHAREDVLFADLASSSKEDSRVRMNFPSKPAARIEHLAPVHTMLQTALGIEPESVLFAGLSEIGDLFVELSYAALRTIPYEGLNYQALMEWDGYQRGVIVSCVVQRGSVETEDLTDDESAGDDDHYLPDFLSRFFGPKAGINEDPVTGSAHCVLAPYYMEKLGKDHVVGHQVSSRGGVVECSKKDDRIQMTGSVVMTMRGQLLI